jgi:TetR/AcrR family transcriptional regulator, mexJK operon transcriptional repressor
MSDNERVGRPVDHSKGEAIFAAAHALLFRYGPAGVSVEAVARQAGVSKVTIYSRYANREALIDAVISKQANHIAASLSIAPDSQNNAHDALTAFGIRLLTFLLSEDHLSFMRALRSTNEFPVEAMRKIFCSGPQTTLDKLGDWMQHAHRAGLANFNQPEKSAELLLGMLMGLDIIRAMYGEPCQRDCQNIERHVGWIVTAFLKLH